MSELADVHTQIHQFVLTATRTDLIRLLSDHNDSLTDQLLLKKIFRNYRWSRSQNRSQGIRLSLLGNQLMQKHYECHTYKYQGSRNHRIFIALDQHMRWPYYLSRDIISFYNDQDAAWFQLNNQDIENFVNFI